MRLFLRSGGFEVTVVPGGQLSFAGNFLYRELVQGECGLSCMKLNALRNEVGCEDNNKWIRLGIYDVILYLRGYCDCALRLKTKGVLSPGTFQDLRRTEGPFYTVLGDEVVRVDLRGCRAEEDEGVNIKCNGEFSLTLTLTGWGPRSLKRD